MSIFTYVAYGLNIASEIECPELVFGNAAPDVRVRYGHVPERLENPTAQGVLYQSSFGRFLLRLEHVAGFLVSDGCDIAIERAPEATDNDIRVFLLGSVFGAVLHQRGFLPLHASAIETSKGAVAFAGPVGFGKSTLAAAFHQRGYRVLADDICAVSLDGNARPVVMPAYPRLNLWADALEKMGCEFENLSRTRVVTEKYGWPVSARFSVSSVPLYALYELRMINTPDIKLTQVKGLDKIALVQNNIFRPRFLKAMNQNERRMANVAAIAQRIQTSRIERPAGVFLLDELADRVENDFQP